MNAPLMALDVGSEAYDCFLGHVVARKLARYAPLSQYNNTVTQAQEFRKF
jgi:hypothetical protein